MIKNYKQSWMSNSTFVKPKITTSLYNIVISKARSLNLQVALHLVSVFKFGVDHFFGSYAQNLLTNYGFYFKNTSLVCSLKIACDVKRICRK